jgi:hypothetical protein
MENFVPTLVELSLLPDDVDDGDSNGDDPPSLCYDRN